MIDLLVVCLGEPSNRWSSAQFQCIMNYVCHQIAYELWFWRINNNVKVMKWNGFTTNPFKVKRCGISKTHVSTECSDYWHWRWKKFFKRNNSIFSHHIFPTTTSLPIASFYSTDWTLCFPIPGITVVTNLPTWNKTKLKQTFFFLFSFLVTISTFLDVILTGMLYY